MYTHVLRGSEGKGAKERSTEKSKFLLVQSRRDLGTTSQASTDTSPGQVSHTTSYFQTIEPVCQLSIISDHPFSRWKYSNTRARRAWVSPRTSTRTAR